MKHAKERVADRSVYVAEKSVGRESVGKRTVDDDELVIFSRQEERFGCLDVWMFECLNRREFQTQTRACTMMSRLVS